MIVNHPNDEPTPYQLFHAVENGWMSSEEAYNCIVWPGLGEDSISSMLRVVAKWPGMDNTNSIICWHAAEKLDDLMEAEAGRRWFDRHRPICSSLLTRLRIRIARLLRREIKAWKPRS